MNSVSQFTNEFPTNCIDEINSISNFVSKNNTSFFCFVLIYFFPTVIPSVYTEGIFPSIKSLENLPREYSLGISVCIYRFSSSAYRIKPVKTSNIKEAWAHIKGVRKPYAFRHKHIYSLLPLHLHILLHLLFYLYKSLLIPSLMSFYHTKYLVLTWFSKGPPTISPTVSKGLCTRVLLASMIAALTYLKALVISMKIKRKDRSIIASATPAGVFWTRVVLSAAGIV